MTKDYAKRSSGSSSRRNRRRQNRGQHSSSNRKLWLFTVGFFILFTLGLVYLGKYRQHQRQHMQAKNIAQEIKDEQQSRRTEERIEQIATKKEKKLGRKKLIESLDAEQTQPALLKPEHSKKPQFEFTTPQTVEEVIREKTKEENKEVKKAEANNTARINHGSKSSEQKEQAKDHTQETEAISSTSAPMLAKTPSSVSIKNERYLLEIIRAKNYVVVDRIKARMALMGYEAKIIRYREQNNVYYKLILGPYEKSIALTKQRSLAKNKMKTTLRKI